MNNIDLKVLPSKVVFTIWLQQLIYSRRAKFSKTHKSVIELNSGVCSMFGFGRHSETNHPIIAAPRPLVPWFFMGRINRVIVSKNNIVYVEFGEDNSTFYLSIHCSRKRTSCLFPKFEETQDLVNTVDFHGYIETENNTVELTQALNRSPIILVRSFDEIIAPKDIQHLNYDDCLDENFDITDLENFDKLKDPIIF